MTESGIGNTKCCQYNSEASGKSTGTLKPRWFECEAAFLPPPCVMELTTKALATPCRPSHGTLPEVMHPAKLLLHPGGYHFSTGLFFTGYIMFSDVVGITKLYQRYKIYDIFISFLRNCIFMFFKNLILIYAWKSLPPSKEMSPENVKTCE